MAVNVLTKLSKKEKTILFVAVVVVILAIFDRVILNIVFSKIESLDENIKIKELLIKKDLKTLALKDKIRNLDKRYSAYAVKAKSTEEEISAILKDIETLASKSSIVLIEVKPASAVDEKLIKKYSVALNCEGTMEQLANFVDRIENSTELFAVDSYSLTLRDKEKGILRSSMNLSKVVMP